MLTKNEVEKIKSLPTKESSNAFGESAFVKIDKADLFGLIETLESAVEVIKEYDFEKRFESQRWGIDYNSDRIKVKPKMFLAEYEGEG